MSAYLRRFTSITPEVVLDTGSSISPADAPRLTIMQMKWSEDSSSFVGQYSNPCSANLPVVRGQVAGGKLVVSFDGVCVRQSLLTKDATGNQSNGDQLRLDPCHVTLTPNEQGDMLQGPMYCVGMSEVMTIRLPFGA